MASKQVSTHDLIMDNLILVDYPLLDQYRVICRWSGPGEHEHWEACLCPHNPWCCKDYVCKGKTRAQAYRALLNKTAANLKQFYIDNTAVDVGPADPVE